MKLMNRTRRVGDHLPSYTMLAMMLNVARQPLPGGVALPLPALR